MNTSKRSGLKSINGLSYFEIPEMARLGWVRHAFLTRLGGVSPAPYDSLNMSNKDGDQEDFVFKNRNHVATAFRFDSRRFILLDQMQQDQILLLRESIITLPSPIGDGLAMSLRGSETTQAISQDNDKKKVTTRLEYDAMITDSPNTFLGILTADCVPIFAIDEKRKIIAAIHAGRQGTSLQITSKVLKKMKGDLGCLSRDFFIGIGPSIGSCCYEIDEKVFQPDWVPFSTAKGPGKWMVDLVQINIAQIKSEGIKEEQIFWVNSCTRCNSDLFFSYRGEGRTGRQLSFIGMVYD